MSTAITRPRTEGHDSDDAAASPRRRTRPVAEKPGLASPEQLRIDSNIPGKIGPVSGNGAAVSNAATEPGGPEPEDDSPQGLAMFVIFTAAVLFVTGAVALLALVGSWWMLGLAFAIHAAATAVVMLTILHVMVGPKRAIPVGDRRSPTPTANSDHRTDRVAMPGVFAPRPPRMGAVRGRADIGTSGAGASTQATIADGVTSAPAPVRDMPGVATEAQGVAGRHRVLVVTDENLAEANKVPDPIRPLVDQATDIYVLAPTLTTRLQSLTGDIDRARLAAGDRLRTVFDHMHADGHVPGGTVGDEDQVTAIADALADFDADLMLLRLHAPGSKNENWREHRLTRRVRSHFKLPTITFFFDDQGQVVGREVLDAPLTGAARSMRIA